MFVPIGKQNLILKNGGRRSFFYETKASMSFIPMSRMSLWCLIMKGKKIIMWIIVCSDWQMNFEFKRWQEEKLFLWNQNINVSYPNEENKVMIPNHEKEGDYYVNLCSSQLTNELWFWKNGGKRSFSYEAKASMSFIPVGRIFLWCPIMKGKEIIMWIHVHPNWQMSFDSKNMVGRKAFLMKPKHQYHLS